MGTLLLVIVVALNVVLLAIIVGLRKHISNRLQAADLQALENETVRLREALTQQFTSATADMAMRLESTKGSLRQEVTDRLGEGFKEIRTSVEAQLAGGRRGQASGLREARRGLT